jgi:hypothetical protein
MHDYNEAIQIYNEEKAKNPNYDTILVEEWREQMPDEFTRKMLKKKYGCHIVDRKTYDEAVELFDWVSDKGSGAKWSVDDIKNVSGIDFDSKDYTLLDFAYTMNMFWSDFCNVFTELGYYIKMSRNYLEDPDYTGDASERAYHDAIKRIRYFDET